MAELKAKARDKLPQTNFARAGKASLSDRGRQILMGRRRNPWVGIGVNALGARRGSVIGDRAPHAEDRAGWGGRSCRGRADGPGKDGGRGGAAKPGVYRRLGTDAREPPRRRRSHTIARKVRANRRRPLPASNGKSLSDRLPVIINIRSQLCPNEKKSPRTAASAIFFATTKVRLKTSVEESRSLSDDARLKAKTNAKPGQGDRGDRHAE